MLSFTKFVLITATAPLLGTVLQFGKLKESKAEVTISTGNPVQFLGKAVVLVFARGKANLTLLVVEEGKEGTSLLGTDWIGSLGINNMEIARSNCVKGQIVKTLNSLASL